MKFIVQKEVFEKLDDYCVGAVVAYNIDNTKKNEEIADLLQNQTKRLAAELCDVNLKQDPRVLKYRNAMQTVDINPNRFPCSIEAMLKRVQKGNHIPSVNAVVDLNNYISLKYFLPMGTHDIDALSGDIYVRFSKENDAFLPLGEIEEEYLSVGELVYSDALRIRTRKWIHRQSEIGKIDLNSKNIFFPIDGFANFNKEKILQASNELAELLKKYFGCEVYVGFADKNCNEIDIK